MKFLEHAFSGWMTAVVFSVILGVVFHILQNRKQLKLAKGALKYEMRNNIHHLNYIYWKHVNPDKAPRDIQHPSISLYEMFAPIILSRYPKIANNFMFLFSAFREIEETKTVISSYEDMHDYLCATVSINETLKLGLNSDAIMNLQCSNLEIR